MVETLEVSDGFREFLERWHAAGDAAAGAIDFTTPPPTPTPPPGSAGVD